MQWFSLFIHFLMWLIENWQGDAMETPNTELETYYHYLGKLVNLQLCTSLKSQGNRQLIFPTVNIIKQGIIYSPNGLVTKLTDSWVYSWVCMLTLQFILLYIDEIINYSYYNVISHTLYQNMAAINSWYLFLKFS